VSDAIEDVIERLEEIAELIDERSRPRPAEADDTIDKLPFMPSPSLLPVSVWAVRGYRRSSGEPAGWIEHESFVNAEQWRRDRWHEVYAASLGGLRSSYGRGSNDVTGERLTPAESAQLLRAYAIADADAAYGPLDGDAK